MVARAARNLESATIEVVPDQPSPTAKTGSAAHVELPSVVIVGRPNVGKSTLFNAILGQRRSIVGDEPGITRDRIMGVANYLGRQFRLIDTGGIIPDDADLIPSEILKQARVALETAAQIIFLIDGRSEITGTDRDLAAMLRRLGKPVVLVVNKIDSHRREDLAHEFHSLRFEHLFPVSSEHRLGIDELLRYITRDFAITAPAPEKTRKSSSRRGEKSAAKAAAIREKAQPKKIDEEEALIGAYDDGTDSGQSEDAEGHGTKARPIKVAIIGRPNVGKSTLLNALAGSERSIVSPIAGTTRDAVDEAIVHNDVEYIFVDTAGIRRKGKTKLMAEKLSVVMARRHLRMCHVAVLVLDASEGIMALDTTIAGYAHEEGRGVIICVNKWDCTKEPDKRKFLENIHDEFKFLDYAPIVFTSAQKKQGTHQLFALIKKAYDSASRRITTGELNRFVSTLKWEYDARIYYITQGGIRPPTFIVFTDKAQKLHFSAERFLINRLRERFDFEGTPIVVKSKRR